MHSRNPRTWLVAGKLFIAMLVLAPLLPGAPQGSGFKLIRKIPIGGEGRWDYLSFDPEARRLYVSHLAHIVVIDADAGKVVGDIDTGDPQFTHRAVVAREFGRIFTSNAGNSSVGIFDLKTLAKIDEVKTDPGTDAIIYDPASKRVFTFNGRSKNSTAIDPATGKLIGRVPLPGRPEFPEVDGRGHLWVNIADKSMIASIDPETLELKASWPVAPCVEPSGLAADVVHHRLFAGCRNKLMVMVNADTGAVLGSVPIGPGIDADRFDPGNGYAYASTVDGMLTIAHEDTPDKLTLVDNVKTQIGARTMEVDPKTHHVYVISADLGPPTAEAPDNPRAWPILPNTFVVLEYGK
jgi:DNA-binding beta-propeller fold protein YncE